MLANHPNSPGTIKSLTMLFGTARTIQSAALFAMFHRIGDLQDVVRRESSTQREVGLSAQNTG